MSSLDVLRHRLTVINSNIQVRQLGDARPMKQLAEKITEKFGTGKTPSSQSIASAVHAYIKTGKLKDFRALKYVCYGIATTPNTAIGSVLTNDLLRPRLLKTVEALKSHPRKFRLCYQGLLTAFFSNNLQMTKSGAISGYGQKLQDFLAKNRHNLLAVSEVPDWVLALDEHKDVLTSVPCQRYGKNFLRGNAEPFESMCSRLNIGKTSWIREQVVLSAVEAAITFTDTEFRSYIQSLLNSLRHTPSIRLAGVRRLLSHYASLKSPREHPELRAHALELMGNPLLTINNQRWHDVSSIAKKMVGDWLKLSVISQFFELLSHDGVTDKRRVNFWSAYVPVIENIWIVFGTAAQSSGGTDFNNLRTLLGDHALRLEGASRKNNAFIMKINGTYVIEFGETGNAVYVYEEKDLPFTLTGALHVSRDLKQGKYSLSHSDRGQLTWEDRFRHELRFPRDTADQAFSHYGAHNRASAQESWAEELTQDWHRELRVFCVERGLQLESNTARGCSIVVYSDNLNLNISEHLRNWGFQYDNTNVRWTKVNQ